MDNTRITIQPCDANIHVSSALVLPSIVVLLKPINALLGVFVFREFLIFARAKDPEGLQSATGLYKPDDAKSADGM